VWTTPDFAPEPISRVRRMAGVVYEDLKNFPVPSALDALRRRGITHVIVHDQTLYDATLPPAQVVSQLAVAEAQLAASGKLLFSPREAELIRKGLAGRR
jgi:hypothetical protein